MLSFADGTVPSVRGPGRRPRTACVQSHRQQKRGGGTQGADRERYGVSFKVVDPDGLLACASA